MQGEQEDQSGAVRSELVERLRALEAAQSPGTLADISYKRAREALERALEEARSIRLQAIEDARRSREHELTSLMESLRSLRESAESQIEGLLRTAELEAGRIRDQARAEAQQIIERAGTDAEQARTEATALRQAAELRLKEIETLEDQFNEIARAIAQRLGITEEPGSGWWRRLGSSRRK
jgi:hypothetical protein